MGQVDFGGFTVYVFLKLVKFVKMSKLHVSGFSLLFVSVQSRSLGGCPLPQVLGSVKLSTAATPHQQFLFLLATSKILSVTNYSEMINVVFK